MASRLRHHEAVLRILAKASPAVARKIILDSKTDLINILSECAINILNGNVPLTPKRKQHLRKFKSNLRQLARKKASVKSRKQVLIQRGGFLPALLGPILTVVLPALARTVMSAIAGGHSRD